MIKSAQSVRTVALGEIVEFLDHLRRPITEADRRPGQYPYFGANGIQGYIDDFIFDEPLVLLAEDGGHFDEPHRGIAYRICGKTWVNNHAHVLRPGPQVDLAYLCRVLENFNVAAFISGTTRAKLTKARASQLPIPLPSLDEQRRIAAILDQADDLRRKRQLSLDKLGALPQAIFREMFGSDDLATSAFGAHKLESVCTRITDGTHQSPSWSSSGVPFIFVSNVRHGIISLKTDKFISHSVYRELTRTCPIEVGDVLYTAVGSYGHAAVISDPTPFAFQRHVAQLKPNITKIDPNFLAILLESPALRRQADQVARGAAQKTVTLADLKSFSIICPPIELQRQFASRIKAAVGLRESYKTAIAQLEAFFRSLQYHAFEGALQSVSIERQSR